MINNLSICYHITFSDLPESGGQLLIISLILASRTKATDTNEKFIINSTQ